MRSLLILSLIIFVGCKDQPSSDMKTDNPTGQAANSSSPNQETQTESQSPSDSPVSETSIPKTALGKARAKFTTKIVKKGPNVGPAETPPGKIFNLVKHTSPVGELDAYITKDPGDGEKHPAIIWITGGDNNSIGDVWSPNPRENDQSASAFRKAGIVMMFPSQRGGNANPGQREGFYGEVDDVLAAADYLEKLPYVDPQRIYLGGHSTGGTLVMLVAEITDRFAGTFSLGPVASPIQYGGEYMYCNTSDEEEVRLRAPIEWMNDVRKPLFIIEGSSGNWDGSIELMAQANKNPNIKFFKVNGHDHFSVIAPVTELIAKKIVSGNVSVVSSELQNLR